MPYPPPKNPVNLIPAHGGYRNLKSFQHAELVYDATVTFCDRFIDKRSRTHDQMVQAARSGRQNIAEGSQASGTSKKFELKLVGVARASLEELLLDFEDFLRERGLPMWGKDHPTAQVVRRLGYQNDRSYSTYSPYVEKAPPETAGNTIICLIHQTNYLLDQQLRQLKRLSFKTAALPNGSTTQESGADRSYSSHRFNSYPSYSYRSYSSYWTYFSRKLTLYFPALATA
jgi:four helix bundle protein